MSWGDEMPYYAEVSASVWYAGSCRHCCLHCGRAVVV
jgi:hypothetical protein